MIIIDTENISINNTNMDKLLYVTLVNNETDEEIVVGKDPDGNDIKVKISKLPTPNVYKILNRVKIWVHAWVTHSEIYYINSIFGSKFYMTKAKFSRKYDAVMLEGFFYVGSSAIGTLVNGNYRSFEDKSNDEIAELIGGALENAFINAKELDAKATIDFRTDSFIHQFLHNPKNIKKNFEVRLLQAMTDEPISIDFAKYGGNPPFSVNLANNENLRSVRDSFSTDIFFLVKTSFYNFIVLHNIVDPRFQIIDHTDLRVLVGDRSTETTAPSDMFDLIPLDEEIYFTIKFSSVTGKDMCNRILEDAIDCIDVCRVIESGTKTDPKAIIREMEEQLSVLFM